MTKPVKFVYLGKHFTCYLTDNINVFSVAKDFNGAVRIFKDIPFTNSRYWFNTRSTYLEAYPVFKMHTEEDKLFDETNWKDSLRFYTVVDDEIKEISADTYKMMEFIYNGTY